MAEAKFRQILLAERSFSSTRRRRGKSPSKSTGRPHQIIRRAAKKNHEKNQTTESWNVFEVEAKQKKSSMNPERARETRYKLGLAIL